MMPGEKILFKANPHPILLIFRSGILSVVLMSDLRIASSIIKCGLFDGFWCELSGPAAVFMLLFLYLVLQFTNIVTYYK